MKAPRLEKTRGVPRETDTKMNDRNTKKKNANSDGKVRGVFDLKLSVTVDAKGVAEVAADVTGPHMSTRITAEEAKKLLDGTTPGPWRARKGRNALGEVRIVESSRVDIDVACVIDVRAPQDGADSRLIAAAPDLAATVIAQAAEVEQLTRELTEARATITGVRAIVDGLCHGEECPGDDDADACHCGLAEMQSALDGGAR